MTPLAAFAVDAVLAIVNAIVDDVSKQQAIDAIVANLKPSPPADLAPSYADHRAEATGQK